jgi:hypothetical protein
MKNILARGGIEFLAVLVGLSGSLWIDGNVKENEAIVQNNEILNRLYANLRADSSDGEWNRKAYERGIKGCARIIEWCDSNPTFDSVDDSIEKDISAILIATYFGNNDEEYNSLKNSGQMHLIKNNTLISDLHRYYSGLGWSDYMDRDTWRVTEEEISPFLSNYSDELYYYRGDNKKRVFSNYPKINLIRLPNIEKLRFYASKKLMHHEHQSRAYNRIVSRVTKLRSLLRKELNIK